MIKKYLVTEYLFITEGEFLNKSETSLGQSASLVNNVTG
jgi:hypothetical protein